jgi:hypothetical protein
VLPIRIRDLVTEKIADPGSGIRKKHPGSYFQELSNNYLVKKRLKFFNADPDQDPVPF